MRIFGTLLLILLLGAGGVWWFRDSLPFVGRDGTVEVSRQAADDAAEKLEGLRPGAAPVRLSSAELSSLLRYRAPAWAPARLRDPAVRITGDTLYISAMIPTDDIPSHPDLDRVRGLLPDSARVEVAGSVRSIGGSRAALAVRQVEFAGIPIPERYYPPMLDRLGRRDVPGLAPEEMALPLPPGVREVRVEDDYLILFP